MQANLILVWVLKRGCCDVDSLFDLGSDGVCHHGSIGYWEGPALDSGVRAVPYRIAAGAPFGEVR